jgi:hypothetical protein
MGVYPLAICINRFCSSDVAIRRHAGDSVRTRSALDELGHVFADQSAGEVVRT